jgi:hypothetical protein
VLLMVTFTLLRPGFWWDMVYPPLQEQPASKLEQMIGELPGNGAFLYEEDDDPNMPE